MIRYYRRKAGMTQAKLAEKLGVSPSAVAMWERGKSAPRAAMLPKLAKVLKTTVDKLLTA